jgi:hypothetical protein
MNHRSDASRALTEEWGITGITSLQDKLNTSEHLPRAPGINHFTSSHLHLNPQVAFYPSNRIYHYFLSHFFSSLFFLLLDMDSGSIWHLGLLFEEGCHFVPEARLAATDAGMPCLYGPAGPVVEFGNGTIVIGIRPFAAHHV